MKNEKYNTHSSRNAIEVYEKDGKWYKVYDEERKTYNVLFEALNQSRVESAGLCVPKLLETCVIDGHWAIVQEYIEGKTMKQKLRTILIPALLALFAAAAPARAQVLTAEATARKLSGGAA